MKSFSGRVLFLDRSDINTDEIIPAKYLTGVTKKELKSHLLEDLQLEEFNPETDLEGINVIITRANFGCGSSREHAPWALELNGINLVIAQSFARIFKQNMFNCGMMAIELDAKTIDFIFSVFSGSETTVVTDLDKNTFNITGNNQTAQIPFFISVFDSSLVKAGGWVDYADSKY